MTGAADKVGKERQEGKQVQAAQGLADHGRRADLYPKDVEALDILKKSDMTDSICIQKAPAGCGICRDQLGTGSLFASHRGTLGPY